MLRIKWKILLMFRYNEKWVQNITGFQGQIDIRISGTIRMLCNRIKEISRIIWGS